MERQTRFLVASIMTVLLLVPGVTASGEPTEPTDDPNAGEPCPPQQWVAISTSPPFVDIRWDCLPA